MRARTSTFESGGHPLVHGDHGAPEVIAALLDEVWSKGADVVDPPTVGADAG